MSIGAIVEGEGTRFRVWAPRPARLQLELDGGARRLELAPVGDGYHEVLVPGVGPGSRYGYLLDGGPRRPDPASRAQPDGVHGASAVVDPTTFQWRHPRRPRRLAELVIYELHVGCFTTAGTFDAAITELDGLVALGVTAVELMPVASFSGARNWGYDGVDWFAPQSTYGGPEGLRRLVDACHGRGLTVLLDVVYNHFGPEGNYISLFGPYFTRRFQTPWGDAIDYAAPPVRRFILDNVQMWLDEYRFDGLRLDAVHAIGDDSPRHIVAEIAELAHERGALVIAESDLGEVKVIREAPAGWGCDAQWSDDFHHALHAVVTKEGGGYYADFGRLDQLSVAVREGFVYQGQLSHYRGRAFGTPSAALPAERFVICAQNHDQVGNRAQGERLGHLAPGCEYAVAATYLLAPAVPLIFMGEEYGEPAPFLYFTDHQDPALGQAVREGRRREFPSWEADEVPDPQAPETQARSILTRPAGERHAGLRRFYQALLMLRRERAELRALDRGRSSVLLDEAGGGMAICRRGDETQTVVAVSLQGRPARLPLPPGEWQVALDAAHFGGPAGARRDGAELWLPPFGALVLVR